MKTKPPNITTNCQKSEIQNGILLGVISLILLVGNPGLVSFGSVARHLCMVSGAVILLFIIISKLLSDSRNLLSFLIIVGMAFLLEFFQYSRAQEVFDTTLIIFRIILYMAFTAGFLVFKPGASALKRFSPEILWGIITSLVLLLSTTYATALILGKGYSTNNRQVADESMNPNGIAYVYASLMIVSIILCIKNKNWLLRITSYFAAALCLYILTSTSARGALISAGISLLTIFLCYVVKPNQAKSRVILLISSGFALSSLFLSIALTEIESLILRFNSLSTGGDRSSIARLDLWDWYWDKLDQWIYFGLEGYDGRYYPHNLFFELILRWGIIGFILSFLIIFMGCKLAMIMYIRPSSHLLIVLAVFIFSFLNAQTSLSIEMNRWLIWSLGIGTGLTLGYLPPSNPFKKPKPGGYS